MNESKKGKGVAKSLAAATKIHSKCFGTEGHRQKGVRNRGAMA
jgi:hypothetical protein